MPLPVLIHLHMHLWEKFVTLSDSTETAIPLLTSVSRTWSTYPQSRPSPILLPLSRQWTSSTTSPTPSGSHSAGPIRDPYRRGSGLNIHTWDVFLCQKVKLQFPQQGVINHLVSTEFSIPSCVRFCHVLFWELPCPAWAVASCSSGPQAGGKSIKLSRMMGWETLQIFSGIF